MRDLRSEEWKTVYRTGKDDLFKDFYSKALLHAVTYDRAVGYFSTELLVRASQGITNLIKNNGQMRLIIGSPLDSEEYVALKSGISTAWIFENIENKLLSILDGDEGNVSRHRLTVFSWLIACKKLEIKFAFRRKGMYHEKIGIIKDIKKNTIVFTGSANETISAMDSCANAESISVYQSWNKYVFEQYGTEYEKGFESLWNNEQLDTITLDLPSTTYEKLALVAAENGKPDALLFDDGVPGCDIVDASNSKPVIPKYINGDEFKIRPHQQHALMKWKAANYRGIFKHATGSGKTFTAIYGAVKIYESSERLAIIVAVPYVELAIQWIANLQVFRIIPHECFENTVKWHDRLKTDILAFLTGGNKFLSVVVVNKTLQSADFKKLIEKIPSDDLYFIGDECHRHGAEATYDSLPNASLRLGLSATPYQDDDDEIDSPFPDKSKQYLTEYYGDVVDEYLLSEAINDGLLTPYNYYVHPCELTVDEFEKYLTLTTEIGKLLSVSKANRQQNESLTLLCAKRSRLVGSASNKISTLDKMLQDIDDKSHSLFYCAEGFADTDSENDFSIDIKNIDIVSSVLAKHEWKSSQFTSSESKASRKEILESFLKKNIDALVSMKVLDEGIDLPVCKRAFILASSKNPRQYIQRRGRILRKFRGKKIAHIHDFIVLPPAHEVDSSVSKKLMQSERERIDDFLLLARNNEEVHQELNKIGI